MKCPNCFADKQTAKQCPSCGYDETLAEQNPLYLKPQTLLNQRYLIGHVIGHGGFGITYISWDIKLERKVAIKEFLPTALATRTSETNEGQTKYTVTAIGDQKEAFKIGLKKFLKEAKILAGFAHDNIVRVIDYFENHETGYIVMEYVGQEDLSQLVKRQPEKRLAVAPALEILLPILNALKIIHANGIYHQDISLQNIRMVDGNKPVLIDFGAARYIVREISQSVEKVFKPGYSPVEQITSSGKVGPWTDIYACGAMFYAMVVGELPPQSVDRLDRDDLIPPDQKIAISPVLNEAVLKALSVRIGDRFQTAEEFETALTSPTLKAKKKKRLLAVTKGVFLMIAVAAVGVVVFDQFDFNWEIPAISDSEPSSIVTSVPPSVVVDEEIPQLVPQPEDNQNVQPAEEEATDSDETMTTKAFSADRQQPQVEVKLNSVYQIGDIISYSIHLKDDGGLDGFIFKVKNSSIDENQKLNGNKEYDYYGRFFTDDWKTGQYTYLSTGKDQAGNTATKEGRFVLEQPEQLFTSSDSGALVLQINVPAKAVLNGLTLPDSGSGAKTYHSFSDLEPETYRVKIWTKGYRTQAVRVSVKPNEITNYFIDLESK